MKLLNKSKYLKGRECPRSVWIEINQPDKIRKFTIAEEFRISEGIKIGKIAKNLYPDGIDLPTDHQENLKASKDCLKDKKPLFEAGFEFNNCYSRADILDPIGNEWDIVEVKSGTSVKDIHVHDVSFQKYVYEGNGLKIRKCFILHLNKEYIRNGGLNFNQLFEKEDITDEVGKAINGIDRRIEEVFDNIANTNQPTPKILLDKFFKDGKHDCFLEGCVDFPDNNVFRLYRGGKKSLQLYEEGIKYIGDIPDNAKLNDQQGIQRDCEKNGKIHVDTEGIEEFLNNLSYPLYYLDFETFSTAVPMFSGLVPYFKIPFQYSLHVVEKKGDEPKHFEFLYSGESDPREEFISSLKKVLGEKGSVVVYYQSFEIKRLEELAEYLPEYKEWVGSIIERIVDLWVPFRNFYYYNPVQQGSASLKKVLPAITEKGYDGMDIADGETASVAFYNITYNDSGEETKRKVRENLLEYCRLDTFAEVMIVEKLREVVN